MSEGTLVVNGSLPGSTAVTVEANATLEGIGIVYGPTEIQSGGTLAAGTPTAIGTLTTYDTTLDAGSTAMLRINKAVPTNDIVIANTLTYGGTLTVTNLGVTNPLALYDTFQLFNAKTYVGNFANFSLPPLTTGLTWDVSKLTAGANGSIRVVQGGITSHRPADL